MGWCAVHTALQRESRTPFNGPATVLSPGTLIWRFLAIRKPVSTPKCGPQGAAPALPTVTRSTSVYSPRTPCSPACAEKVANSSRQRPFVVSVSLSFRQVAAHVRTAQVAKPRAKTISKKKTARRKTSSSGACSVPHRALRGTCWTNSLGLGVHVGRACNAEQAQPAPPSFQDL